MVKVRNETRGKTQLATQIPKDMNVTLRNFSKASGIPITVLVERALELLLVMAHENGVISAFPERQRDRMVAQQRFDEMFFDE